MPTPGPSDQLRRLLPQAMVELHGMLGDAGLLALVEAHGGTRVNVPGAMQPEAPLAKLLQLEPATQIAKRWGPGKLNVALCKTWRIHLLRGQGLSAEAVAHRVGVTHQTVYREMRRDRTNGNWFAVDMRQRTQLGFKFD